VTTDNGGYNVNFYELVPTTVVPNLVMLTVSADGADLIISFPTQTGFSYQLEYKDNLKDINWMPLGSVLSGNNSFQTVTNINNYGSRFYRMLVE
jgi:hypothetical protein